MKANALERNLEIKEWEKKIWTSLNIQHIRDIIKLQAMYGIQYKKDHNFKSLQTPIFVSEDKSALGKTYISKKLVGHIFKVCHEI